MQFDIHTHTYPDRISEKAVHNLGEFYNFKVDGKGTYSDLEAQAQGTGVVGFLLFSVAFIKIISIFASTN